MKQILQIQLAAMLVAILAASASLAAADQVKPIHLDDIHFIVTDEKEAVAFFIDHFGAREMAHPGVRFELVRFLSLKWQGPTITITGTGPYEELPPERNQRWLDADLVLPSSERATPVFGARWLALATPSADQAFEELVRSGISILNKRVELPMDEDARAFSVHGPDGAEIVIVERPDRDFGEAMYMVDHVQFLVSDVEENERFFSRAFAGEVTQRTGGSSRVSVADAQLIISAPAALGLAKNSVQPRKSEGTIRTGLDHLGFLYANVSDAADAAASNAVLPIFKPQRYVYRGKPTVYTFTAFSMPDEFNIEMVQADGRVGPHSYYIE